GTGSGPGRPRGPASPPRAARQPQLEPPLAFRPPADRGTSRRGMAVRCRARASTQPARADVGRALRARLDAIARYGPSALMTRGRLITIEGLDGAGKTTLAAGL